MKKELTQELIKDLKNLIAPENVEKFDELMGIDKPMFRKEDFITGDKVVFRNGDIYLVIRDCNAGIHKNQTFALLECALFGEFMNSDAYNDDLCAGMTQFDIMKIYRSGEGQIRGNSFSTDLTSYSLIWERKI